MRRWLIPVALVSASLPGWANVSRGHAPPDAPTYQLDVSLLQEGPPDSPGAGSPRCPSKFSVLAAEGREVTYQSGGEVTIAGEPVPIGLSLRAVIRREAKGRIHLKLVLENTTIAGRADDRVLLETHDARYTGPIKLGEKVRLTFGEPSAHRPRVELLAQEVDRHPG